MSQMKSDHAKELFHIRAERKIEQEQFGTQEMRREQKCGTSGESCSFDFFALTPFFAGPEREKALSHGPIFHSARTGKLATQAK